MKAKYLFIVLSVLSIFVGCSKKFNSIPDLTDDLIFIRDEYYPMLPAYTELGYNTFGAMYEKQYFVVTKNIIPFKMQYEKGNMLMTLSGIVKSEESGYYNYSESKMAISFIFPFDECKSYKELLKLHNTKINLTSADCQVRQQIDTYSPKLLNVVEGELFFRRSQNLNIDDQKVAAVLSGTFWIKHRVGNQYFVIKNGRFDLSINENYFTYISK